MRPGVAATGEFTHLHDRCVGPCCDAVRVADVDDWEQRIIDTLALAGLASARAFGVEMPAGAGTIIIPLDDAAVAATLSLIDALKPTLAILDEPDEQGFNVHLLGTPWVLLAFMDRESIEEQTAGSSTGRGGLDEMDHETLNAVVITLAATTPFGPHGKHRDARDAIKARLESEYPALAAKVADWGDYTIDQYAASLASELKNRHTSAQHTDAARLAELIAAEETLTPTMTRPVLRNVAYTRLKRLDPSCVTRASVESVVLELDRLARAAR